MHFNWKKFALGVVMTMVSVAVGLAIINRFAPASIKRFFVVTA